MKRRESRLRQTRQIGRVIQPPCAKQKPAITRAAMLDRLADVELQHGHHIAAENLAWRAAELRGAA